MLSCDITSDLVYQYLVWFSHTSLVVVSTRMFLGYVRFLNWLKVLSESNYEQLYLSNMPNGSALVTCVR